MTRLDLEGELLATALSAALDALDLNQDQRVLALGAAQQYLLGAGGDTLRAVAERTDE